MEINLQLFADAGNLVNATGNYVNAYTGQTQAFTEENTLSPGMKTYYDTEMLENTRAEEIYAQFGKPTKLPQNHGKSIEWRKWNAFDRADELQEAVIPTGQKFGESVVTGEIRQFGTYAAISDELELRHYDDVIGGAVEEMSASAAETRERLLVDELLTGTNVMYAMARDESGNVVDVPMARWQLTKDTGKKCLLTPDLVNQAVTWLKKLKAPKINGKYIAVIHPSVAYDLKNHSDWIEAHKYAGVEQIYNGEIGELHGVRFVESADAPVLVGEDLGTTKRRLSVSAAWATTTNQTADYGVADTYFLTVSDTITEKLVGREILVSDASENTTHGHYVVTGVNTAEGYVFAATSDASSAAGDFLVPGEGGHEAKIGGQTAVYATMFFGKNAFSIIDADGGVETIVKPRSDIGGPLDQFSTVGYKLTFGAAILYQDRLVRIESCSSYSGNDKAN